MIYAYCPSIPAPKVFYAWSKRCDAVLEVECTGRWREAYDVLRALGVTDQELVSRAERAVPAQCMSRSSACITSLAIPL